jgi:urea carboxylase-associated protein 2
MSIAKAKSAAAEANRRRYEELRATGQGATFNGLPPQSALGSVPISATAIIHQEEVPGGWYMTTRLRRSEMLRLVDGTGTATPTLVAWREADPSERINLADTVKVQWTAALRRGRILLSDMGRVMLSIVEDTSGAHDALMGGSAPDPRPSATDEPYRRSTRENLIAATAKLGLERRDIAPCISFFAPVSVDGAGRFQWQGGKKRPGDFVDLRAEMDLLVAISNCAHPLQPNSHAEARPIQVVRHSGRAYTPSDPCRNTGAEAVRAFEFTDRLAK